MKALTNGNVKKQTALSGISKEVKRNAPLFTMLLPGFVFTIIFSYLPIFGIIIAFKKFNANLGIFGSPWCGFKNFEFLFNSSDTAVVLFNTIAYNLVFIFLGLLINVALAIVLSMVRNKRLSKVYQTVLIMPHFLSFVIVSYIVYAFLSVENGFLNKSILPLLGIDEVNWYVNTGDCGH